MATVQQVMQIIKDKQIPAQDAIKFQDLLVKCGRYGLDFVLGELDSYESRFFYKYALKSLKDSQDAFESGRRGDWEPLIALLKGGVFKADYNFGSYLIPFVLDFKVKQKQLPANVSQTISEFEINLFDRLPREEIEVLFHGNLLMLLNQGKNLDSLVNYIIENNITDIINWSNRIRASLENNEEIIGSRDLVTDGKQYRPTVKSWLYDFLVSVRKPISALSTFDEVQYLQKSENVKALPKEQVDKLANIIKIYIAVSNPSNLVAEMKTKLQSRASDKKEEHSNQELNNKSVLEVLAGDQEKSVAASQQVMASKQEEHNMPKQTIIADVNKAEKSTGQNREVEKPLMQPPQPAQEEHGAKALKIPEPVIATKPLQKEAPLAANEINDPWGVNYSKPLRPINIQDILSKKKTTDDYQAGIKMGKIMEKQEVNDKRQGSQITDSVVRQEDSVKKKSEEIDKKLDELRKKVGN